MTDRRFKLGTETVSVQFVSAYMEHSDYRIGRNLGTPNYSSYRVSIHCPTRMFKSIYPEGSVEAMNEYFRLEHLDFLVWAEKHGIKPEGPGQEAPWTVRQP